MDITGDTPLLLTTEDQRIIIAAQASLRLLGVQLEIEQPDGGQLREVVYVSKAFDLSETRWAIYRTVAGVRVDDIGTGRHYGPSAMREATDRIMSTVQQETAAVIAAIPVLTLPTLPGVTEEPREPSRHPEAGLGTSRSHLQGTPTADRRGPS
jgi:hypothetical protein